MHVDSDETKTPEKQKKKQQQKQLPLNLKFETTLIEQVSKHRLLGVTVDKQLKWRTLTTSAETFLEIFSLFQNWAKLSAKNQN